ncbi:hypothetical protein [Confluentibacter flavum]|uniref:DUF4393 domain-containing protein n=1 Tax=Confluentibacter flavum TaxID=1909700 RepID=A0A2N3HPA5_9FLAO|nr:hypothetical protein [Confluentibacter flavum]PKQ46761.1 hypothetical protein CSW08_01260 [Confluentibacter flavum]
MHVTVGNNMKNDDLIKIIQSTAISIAASFPGLASVATGWTEYKNHIQTQNIKNIIETFYYKLNEIEHKVNHQYLESDNLKALTIKTCLYGKEEMSEKKREMLSFFLANSCTTDNYNDVTKNAILETIIKLSEFDVFLMNLIAESSKDSQNSILAGTKKYEPNNSSWTALDELDIIEKVKTNSDKEVITTLEYLNAVGVLETLSSRNINHNITSEISRYLKDEKFEDIQRRIRELSNPDDYIKNFRELKKLNEEEEKFIKETKYDENYQYQKTYMITALGLAVLNYIKE